MIRRLVGLALQNRVMVAALVAILFLGGLAAYRRLAIEAYPNPVPPLVEVISQPPGWSAEETERYVTVPLEIGLAGAPGLDHVRSQSLFGLSDVKCYFKWGTDYWAARQEVINLLDRGLRGAGNLNQDPRRVELLHRDSFIAARNVCNIDIHVAARLHRPMVDVCIALRGEELDDWVRLEERVVPSTPSPFSRRFVEGVLSYRTPG